MGSVRVKCRKLDSERRNEKDTASPCSFASFGVSFKVILHTYSDASEEVFICSAAAPMSEEGNRMRRGFNPCQVRRIPSPGGVVEEAEGELKMRCRTVDDIAREVLRLVEDEKSMHPESDAEFFFRGERKNYKSDNDCEALDTAFQSYLDREGLQDFERQLFENAIRLNVASFEEDHTMVERVARMQHYLLPTRFADASTNALLSAHFACGGGENDVRKRDNGRDGFIRVMKVAGHKMKPFFSDTIAAIAHLPLLDSHKVAPSKHNGLGYLTYEIRNSRPGFYDEDMAPEIGNSCGTTFNRCGRLSR